MFYIKTTIDGKQIKVPIYNDEIFTHCFNCGKEFQVDSDLLRTVVEDGDLSSTQIACCNNDKPQLIRIK